MSVCIMFSINEKVSDYSFDLRVWEDKDKSRGWKTSFNCKELLEYDVAQQIPFLKKEEKNIFKKFFLKDSVVKLKCWEGELNMTFHRDLFNKNSEYPKVIKGAQVQRYFLTDNMSQGVVEYLDEEKYLSKNKGEKSQHHLLDRIAIQGISGVNDKIRIIASLIPAGFYIANSCNYIVQTPENYSIKSVLGIINSRFINWIFKKTSTNSNVNTYEISNLSLPTINDNIQKNTVAKIEENVGRILDIKKCNQNEDTTMIEDDINSLVYKLYELGEDDIKIIENE